jgi:DNA (cytosine-5)-methyltransferase 1
MQKIHPLGDSYFSGAGGLDLGLLEAGCDLQQSLDLDQAATDSMKRNTRYFRHEVRREDIAQKRVLDRDRPDFMAFTYPCTKYSTIADIHSARTGDELYCHALRHIAIRQPRAYVLENVPGMKKFPVVMEAMTQLPDYYINVFCPVEASNWLPQKRKRLIVIGTRTPFRIDPPQPERKRITIKDIIELEAKVHVPDCVVARIEGKYRDKPIVVDPDDPEALAPTCVAHYAKDMGTRLVKDKQYKYGMRPFSIREYARLQGFPDDYHFEDKVSSYRLIGNAVPVHMGRWIGQQLVKYFNQ